MTLLIKKYLVYFYANKDHNIQCCVVVFMRGSEAGSERAWCGDASLAEAQWS